MWHPAAPCWVRPPPYPAAWRRREARARPRQRAPHAVRYWRPRTAWPHTRHARSVVSRATTPPRLTIPASRRPPSPAPALRAGTGRTRRPASRCRTSPTSVPPMPVITGLVITSPAVSPSRASRPYSLTRPATAPSAATRGGVGVDRGHDGLPDAEPAAQHLGDRGDAVGGAARAGDHLLLWRRLVDAVHHGRHRLGARGRGQ